MIGNKISSRTWAAITTLTWVSVLAAWQIGAAFAAPSGQGSSTDQKPSINVTGDGEFRAEPDMAVVTVGATALAPASQDAMNEVSRRLAAVIAAAKGLGIEDRDVQTTGLSLQPIYRARPRGDDGPQEIESYRASNNVSLTVKDISRASAVLDAASNSGANVIGGLRFGLQNQEQLRLQALAAATTDADRKARAIASAAGLSLKGVISITEDSIQAPRPFAEGVRAAPAIGGDSPAPPVESGELVIRARIRSSYGI
ncbi:MAG: hypothetical protein HW416_1895 [Chloroflexi bacterium]|nr:hypothetical protein [Chloroflexota bacterium]